MGGGAVQGYAGSPLGTKEENDRFNKKEEEESKLKGKRLEEMYSTSGVKGQSVVKNLTGEEEHEGHVERSKHQGLRNVTESDEMETETMPRAEKEPEETPGFAKNFTTSGDIECNPL